MKYLNFLILQNVLKCGGFSANSCVPSEPQTRTQRETRKDAIHYKEKTFQ